MDYDEALTPDEVVAAASSLPESRRIVVICTRDHQHKPFTMATFRGRGRRWILDEPRYQRFSPTEPIRHLQRRAATVQVLEDANGRRFRYEMTCRRCKRSERLRAERLAEVFTELATRGVERIEMSTLMRML